MEDITLADDPRTTSELVTSLRKHFQEVSKFENVAGILASREEKLKREIEKMRREKDSLEEIIRILEFERLEKIRLEDELRTTNQEWLELKQLVSELERENAGYDMKFKETQVRINRILQHVVGGVERFGRRETELVGWETEGSVDSSVVEGEVVDEEASGIRIGSEGNAIYESDRGGCKVDRLEAESQGTTTPTSGKVVVEILDNDDKPTLPNVAPKEETSHAHSKPGSSGKDETCVLKRKWSSDSGANYNACSDEKKITRHQDSIGGGETTSEQGKLGSAPVLSQTKESMDLACQLAAHTISSSNSDK
ncbi:hypothetical protein LINPERHAP2_LOCUS33119 [Linum perenne]